MNAKQRRFCEEYLIDLNATAAAKRAGYSERTAYSQGHDLLKKPEIQDRIQSLQLERAASTGITAERVLQELAKIGFSDVSDLLNLDGNALSVRAPSEIPKDARKAISSVKVRKDANDESEIIEFKFWDKLSALEKLGKHLGMWTDKLELSGKLELTKAEEMTDDQLQKIARNAKPSGQ